MGRKLLKRKIKLNEWLKPFFEEQKVLLELSSFSKVIPLDYRCVACKGGKFLCGKSRCPVLQRAISQLKLKKVVEKLELEGPSPSVFVGRIGYPYVYIGPLTSAFPENVEIADIPEKWGNLDLERIVELRSQLIRGKYRVNVKKISGKKIVELVREIGLAKKWVDSEIEFFKKPRGKLVLGDSIQPMGPSAPIKNLEISSFKTDKRVEKVFYDSDLKAREAVCWLYRKKVFVSKIQKAFSLGLFGIEKNRRFVPTRWSITAVDSTISRELLEKVKEFKWINDFKVFTHTALDNRWIVLMIPSFWSYELIEAWYPGTIWNPFEREVAIFSDCEGFEGRNDYAQIGGCYYAARLAVAEYLERVKRQAMVIIFRETHPGYTMPVGVWNVRENVRRALRENPIKFEKLKDALSFISSKLEISMKEWIKASDLLKNLIYQKKIKDFLKR